MARVAFITFDEIPSFKGASTHVLAGLRHLLPQHQLTLISLGANILPAEQNFRHQPLEIRERNYLRRALEFQSRVSELLSRETYDLIHFRGPFEGLAAIDSGAPTIYEVNAFPSIELNYYYRNLPDSVLDRLRAFELFCLQRTARIVCPSERLRHCILSARADAPVYVLPNGYDPVPIKSFETHQGPLRGVYLGTLSPWQGILWALKAFRDLNSEFSLTIFAPYQKQQWQRAEARIRRYGLADRVRLLPPVPKHELTQELQNYDFALAPLMKTERNTRQGCCPLKILDYLAHGLPTIAADLFVVREIIRDPAYPLFFHPGSVLSLREKLLELQTNRARIPELSRIARANLNGHPTWEDYGRILSRHYAEVLATNHDRPRAHATN